MKIWDLPLRLFHWLFAISVIGSIISGKLGNWDFHERFGLTILGLLAFRFFWGFFGSETAQFKNFLKGPVSVLQNVKAMMKRQVGPEKGHSALGGWATMALLFVPTYLVSTGLFSTDGTLFDGPFAHLVSFDRAEEMADLHHIGEKFLFLVLFLHFSAMAIYYFWLKKNLIPPMITGSDKQAVPVKSGLSRNRQIGGLFLLFALIGGAQTFTMFRPALF